MARAPVLPTNLSDPTGTDAKERAAMAEFNRRVRRCRDAYLALLEKIEFNRVTVNAERYEFRLLPQVLTQLLEETGRLVDQLLGADNLRNWFTVQYVIPAYEKGAAQGWRNLGIQSTEYQALRPTLQSLLLSEPYQNRIGLIRAREFELMKGLSASVKQGLSQQLTAGLAQGIGPREIARNITKQTGIEERRAAVIARTEINQSLRTARLDETQDAASRLQIKVKVLHISALSPTTRPTHAARSGQLYTVAEERDWYSQDGNAINCFLPGTRVRGRFVGGSKSLYDGPVVHIVTVGGNEFTVTPNHPLLTDCGRLAAGQIRKGDYLFANPVKVENPSRVGDLDSQLVGTAIEDVFAALSEVGHTRSARVSAVDLHGDAQFVEEQIDVVGSDRVLTFNLQPESAQLLDYLQLKHTDPVKALTERPFNPDLHAVDLPPALGVSCSRHGFPVFGSALGMSDVGTFAPTAVLKPIFTKPTVEGDAGDPDILGDGQDGLSSQVSCIEGGYVVPTFGSSVSCAETYLFESLVKRPAADADFVRKALDAFPGLAAFDQVVEVNVLHFRGHVYDLEEVSGGMIAENITLWNCKCTSSEVLVDDQGQPLSKGLVDRLRKASDAWKARQEDKE